MWSISAFGCTHHATLPAMRQSSTRTTRGSVDACEARQRLRYGSRRPPAKPRGSGAELLTEDDDGDEDRDLAAQAFNARPSRPATRCRPRALLGHRGPVGARPRAHRGRHRAFAGRAAPRATDLTAIRACAIHDLTDSGTFGSTCSIVYSRANLGSRVGGVTFCLYRRHCQR